DRAYRPAAAHRAQPVAAGTGEPARDIRKLSQSHRARSADRERHLADQARRDIPPRSRHLVGAQEHRLEVGLREAFSDPLLGIDAVPDVEIAALAGSSPNAARAVLGLYRAWRVAREDAGGIALPSGRRVLLPNEEARDFFDDRANHFPTLEEAADGIAASCAAAPAEMNHAIAERLRGA